VANTATTGTFTIPMMRSSGLKAHLAAGIEAAASSGGALVPPVMGAGAYMMLEIVTPAVTYLEILRAALIPALLYYFSLLVIVHLQARKQSWRSDSLEEGPKEEGLEPTAQGRWEGVIFTVALGVLVGFLLAGFSVFRAVSLAVVSVLLLSAGHPRTRLGFGKLHRALLGAARGGVPLVTAAACVGVVIGVVTLTGVGTRLPSLVVPLAQDSLLLALVLIMGCSILLGMGLPSAVCYLLMATLLGPALTQLGVVPLAAHLFIFYFGMMSMVTPPVALAAYAASSIAGSRILATSWAAFRFALVGFTLPYLFVFRPQLLMLEPGGGVAGLAAIAWAVLLAILGIVPLAGAIAGHLRAPLGPWARAGLVVASVLALFPGEGPILQSAHLSILNLAGIALFLGMWLWAGRRSSEVRQPQ
jgi:TRAP transporter 4TM/12TM fusion protein